MPRRTFQRPRNPRTLGRKVIVVCEGKKTEPGYFEAIRQSMRLPTLRIRIIHPEGTDPLTLVRAAIEEKRTQLNERAWFAGDRIWVVFDGDEHRHGNPSRWNDAIQLARANDIELAISNPCFELWYILHFQAQTAHIDRIQAVQRLRKHVPHYRKPVILWPDPLQSKTEVAIERARNLLIKARHDGSPEFSNPSTSVHELVLSLRALA